jgi:hypothetical protein
MSTPHHKTTAPFVPTTLVPQVNGSITTDQVHSGAALTVLPLERLLAAEAMQLLIRLDRDLQEARAQFNQDWFRRLMRVRPKAVLRLRRRWPQISGPSPIPLGPLRRRYHSNLARYSYQLESSG